MRLAPLHRDDARRGGGLRSGGRPRPALAVGTPFGTPFGTLRPSGSGRLELFRRERAPHPVRVLQVVLQRQRRHLLAAVAPRKSLVLVVERRHSIFPRGVVGIDHVVVLDRGLHASVRVGHLRVLEVGSGRAETSGGGRVSRPVSVLVLGETRVVAVEVPVYAIVVREVVIPLLVRLVFQGDVFLVRRGRVAGAPPVLGRIRRRHLHVSLLGDDVAERRRRRGVEEDLEVVVVLRERDEPQRRRLLPLRKVHRVSLGECGLDLHHRLGAILEEVVDLAAVDADDAEHELAGEAQRQGRVGVDDGLDCLRDVRLGDLLLPQPPVEVRGDPDRPQRAALGEDVLRVEHPFTLSDLLPRRKAPRPCRRRR
mmetsp:Transcript_12602/g.54124  ORF Transcript_12602/g.54124 Transcript_12602/m.54124 type:complete len:367 (-) Transcript_12602:104-1204(-)